MTIGVPDPRIEEQVPRRDIGPGLQGFRRDRTRSDPDEFARSEHAPDGVLPYTSALGGTRSKRIPGVSAGEDLVAKDEGLVLLRISDAPGHDTGSSLVDRKVIRRRRDAE